MRRLLNAIKLPGATLIQSQRTSDNKQNTSFIIILIIIILICAYLYYNPQIWLNWVEITQNK